MSKIASEQIYSMREERDVMIAMRDGVWIKADEDVEETEELLLRDQAPRAGVHVD